MKPPDWLKTVVNRLTEEAAFVADLEEVVLDALNQGCVYAFFAGLYGEAHADLTRVWCVCREDSLDGPCSSAAEYLVTWSDRAVVICPTHLQAARRWASLDGEHDRDEHPRVERLLDGQVMEWTGPYPSSEILPAVTVR